MKLLSLFAGVVVAANNGPSRMTGDACSALGYSPYKRMIVDMKLG